MQISQYGEDEIIRICRSASMEKMKNAQENLFLKSLKVRIIYKIQT
jgi:hypothetical protein